MMTRIATRLFASTALASAFLIAAPASAQEATPDTSGEADTQPTPTVAAGAEQAPQGSDIIVTGSRLPQPNLESAAPVTLVSEDDVKLSGSTRIEDVLNQLPSAAASQNSGLSNSATGTAEVDLRYLGAKRTLSLVNGRRLAPGDPAGTSQAADINIIPASLLKRVEVLTGGASSVYGADAVAGVVNFIIDTNFTGIRFDGNWSVYQHNNDCPGITNGQTVCDALNEQIDAGLEGYDYPTGSGFDGRTIDGTVSIGASFDDGRGHALGYFGYRKVNALLQGQRDYSACSLGGDEQPFCAGSAFSAEGNFLIFDNGSLNFFTRGADRTLDAGYTLYNFGPLNYYQRPDERYTAGLFADYEINSAMKPYLEFMFMDDRTVAQLAPSGDFANTFTINCDNPFMSAQAQSIVCDTENLISGFVGSYPVSVAFSDDPNAQPLTFTDSFGNPYQQGYFNVFRRNVEGGPRINELKHTTYRGVVGMRGDLTNAFSYDAYYQYGATNYTQVFRNEFSSARLHRALNAVFGTDTDGDGINDADPVCRAALDGTDPSCVPYDLFGTPSAEAINYLNVYGVIDGRTSQQVANVNFTGELGELGVVTPWASDGVGVNVGWEYRKESLKLNPDQAFQSGDLTGQGGPTLPVDGSFRVNEFFAEAQIPIVQHGFIDNLALGAGYRKSWYKLSTGRKYDTDTYKLSLEFAPISDVRFRAAYNRAVRAPNIQELFSPQFVALDGSTDPCAGHPLAASEYGCIAQFKAAGFVDPVNVSTPLNPSEQYNGLLGGNPDLNPEKATTKTVGVVLQPRFIPRLAVTVDYWNIKVDGAIQGFGADTILADCIANSTATAAAPSCALIHRDVTGSLWIIPGGAPGAGFVEDVPTNVGGVKTDGVDVNATYAVPVGSLGRLSLNFNGTYLDSYITDNGIAEPYDCAGFYGTTCSGGAVSTASPLPRWRHKLRATLATPVGAGVSLQWRRTGPVELETLSDQPALSGDANQLSSRIGAQSYFDLALTYTMFDKLDLRAGINNLLDKTPPLVPNANGACPTFSCNGNTYPGAWDYLGRYVWAGATLTFAPPKPLPPAPEPVAAPPPPPPATPATQTCPDGSVILATEACPAPPPPPPPPPPAPERG